MRDFDKTISILVNAYLEGTLVARNCAACAVGNMIAHDMGYKIEKQILRYSGGDSAKRIVWINGDEKVAQLWTRAFVTVVTVDGNRLEDVYQTLQPGIYLNSIINDDDIHKQIDSTGYTFLELARIEKAFEIGYTSVVGAQQFPAEDIESEGQFAGLMAAVDVLAYIHGVDLSTQEEAKKLFKREPQLVE